MKTILYMAISADGYISRTNDDTSWISETEWASYSLAVRTAGNLIVGRRTYDILTKQPEFLEFKNVKLVVVSSQKFQTLTSKHVVTHSPKEALENLKDFENVVVAGGGELNGSFLKKGLIDEIYLDVEPIVLGKGIKLFGSVDIEANLELLETKKLSDSEIQLHYKVLK